MPLNQMGVVPSTTDDRRAPARSVQHFVKAEMFAVEIGDERGEKVQTLVFRVGDAWYHDPDGANWVKKLRPIAKDNWLTQKLNDAQAAAGPVKVPNQDAVDIMRGGK